MIIGTRTFSWLLGVLLTIPGGVWVSAQEPGAPELPPPLPTMQTPLGLPAPPAAGEAPAPWQYGMRRRAMISRQSAEPPDPGPNLGQDPSSSYPPQVDRTFTGPQGQVHTYQRTFSDQGMQTHQSFVGPNGQTRSLDRTITPDGVSWERTFTGPQGQTHTFQREVTGDTVHMQGTLTNPHGQTRTFDRTFTRGTASAGTDAGASPATPDTRPAAPRRSGFTVGSSRRAGWGWGKSVGADSRPAQVQTPGERARLWRQEPGGPPGRGMSSLRSGGRR